MFYWMLKWVFVGPLLKVIFRPYAEGTDNVPEEGAAILASNHLSYSDWLFMPLAIPRRVTFVAKAEYFNTPGLKGWLQRRFFKGAGQVPIDRSGGSASARAISTGLRVLGSGELFGIYPEGTRSPDGRLYRGKTGVARMALDAKVPVIPVAVHHTDTIAPPGRIFGRYARPGVRFGRPLDFSRYEGMEGDRFVLRSITDEIMYAIMELSGQEYVDMYANRAKEVAQAEAKAAAAAAKAEAREAAAAAKAAEAAEKAAAERSAAEQASAERAAAERAGAGWAPVAAPRGVATAGAAGSGDDIGGAGGDGAGRMVGGQPMSATAVGEQAMGIGPLDGGPEFEARAVALPGEPESDSESGPGLSRDGSTAADGLAAVGLGEGPVAVPAPQGEAGEAPADDRAGRHSNDDERQANAS